MPLMSHCISNVTTGFLTPVSSPLGTRRRGSNPQSGQFIARASAFSNQVLIFLIHDWRSEIPSTVSMRTAFGNSAAR
jgi:hypothetical protein